MCEQGFYPIVIAAYTRFCFVLEKNKPIKFKAIGSHCSLPYCYNGHAFIALGDVPEIETVTYANTRNRVCKNESEWLKPEMKEFMNSRLYENNKELSMLKKWDINTQCSLYPRRCVSKIARYIYSNFIRLKSKKTHRRYNELSGR